MSILKECKACGRKNGYVEKPTLLTCKRCRNQKGIKED